MKHYFYIFLIIAGVFFMAHGSVHAQNASVCDDNFGGLSQEALRQKLAVCETELNQQEAALAQQKQKSGTLKGDISVLQADISAKQTKINARLLLIKQLGGEINQKNAKIDSLSDKLDNQKESLAQLIRKTKEFNDSSLVNLVLSSHTLSSFYGDLNSVSTVKDSLKASVDTVIALRNQTQTEKQSLETKKDEEADAKADLEAAQRKVAADKAAHQKLLTASQSQEKAYQKIKDDLASKVLRIKNELFKLAGGGQGIPFGDALTYANFASQKTGVRPAFLLAILTQESNLGTDTGSCYVTNLETGAGISAKSKKAISNVMKPGRDTVPFVQILKPFGRDPMQTLVSCPFSIGYGGAMGPSQFIPSTWVMLVDRLKAALGTANPDPWAPQDAFMASALYLKDLGAGSQSYSAEKNAACKYYSGKSCGAVTGSNSYGVSVMNKATIIQEQKIDVINGI